MSTEESSKICDARTVTSAENVADLTKQDLKGLEELVTPVKKQQTRRKRNTVKWLEQCINKECHTSQECDSRALEVGNVTSVMLTNSTTVEVEQVDDAVQGVSNGAIPKKKRTRTRPRAKKKTKDLPFEEVIKEIGVPIVEDVENVEAEAKTLKPKNRKPKRKENKDISLDSTILKSLPVPLVEHNANILHEFTLANSPNIASTSVCDPESRTNTPKSPQKKKKATSGSSKTSKNNLKFDEYMNENDVLDGLKRNLLIEGVLRINQKNYKEAYVNSPDRGPDILIDGMKDRNRALEGDEVVIHLKRPEDWKFHNDSVQKTGFVVYIRVRNHPLVAVGYLKLMPDKNEKYALFSPRDARVPRMMIPMENCPENFINDVEKYSNTLFLARIHMWSNIRYAYGQIVELLGTVGDTFAETVAILRENDIDTSPYPENLLKYIPKTPFPIPEEEIRKRRDFRNECVFTIDPVTAKDLDDAVSCKELPNGNLEIGVHISDVTHYLTEGTPLDEAVSKRATSTYLVTAVHHMLPLDLCRMCSLLPGVDRLTFSVVWEVTKDGEILSKQFTRSVINSCAQLSYDHAQAILENPLAEWTRDDIPVVSTLFEPSYVGRVVRTLNHIAQKLRSKRFTDGALRIDQPKLVFRLHPDTGVPIAFTEYVQMESHRLIEEFMLLANMTVAEHLKETFPNIAFLRFHPLPHQILMEELQKSMEQIGIHLDISSAGALNNSLNRYSGNDIYSKGRMIVLNSMCARPMARARYFCAGVFQDEEKYWHYALNVPLYTHFTSPIRRYADVMVHRLLAAAIGYSEEPKWIPSEVQEIAAICNKQKYNAKRVGELNSDLYLCFYVGLYGPMKEEGVVLDVKDRSFDVIIFRMGYTLRIYTDKLNGKVTFRPQGKISMLQIEWPPNSICNSPTTQIIQIFSIVTIAVHRSSVTHRLEGTLLHPKL